MAFGSLGGGNDAPMAEINTTPLVDVMLVLLVIFILTAPLLNHAVKLRLPDAQAAPLDPPPDAVTLSIDADGALHWNGDALPETDLDARLAALVAATPQPPVHLRADRDTPYHRIATGMGAATRAGVSELGFVTLPADAATP